MTTALPLKAPLEPTSEVIRILEEYLDELEAGARVNPEKLAARCPELAEPLKACLASLEFLQDAALGLRGSGNPGRPPALENLAELGRLGDFHLVREVGRGGMGVVYEAEQISLGRKVALKVLPFAAALDERQLQRFKNEAQAAACLHHTNIVPVFGVGCERGVHYYAMQFIEGQTLAALIAELRGSGMGGPADSASQSLTRPSAASPATTSIAARSTELSATSPGHFRTAAQLGIQAALALEHAHQLGVVHRDIKPANLLVDVHGDLWVTDFGLAHCQSQGRLTLSGDLVGTLRYMSPEQALAQPIGVDHRTDLYSLGATLYELLTLAPAFSGRDRQELLRQIAFEEPLPPRRVRKAVPAELETIVLKAMAKNPAERYATAQELADDLQRFLKDEPVRARRPTLVQRARKWAWRHRPVVWSAAMGLFMALAVLAGCVGWVVRDRAARRAKITTDLQAVLEEAQRSLKENNWAQALAAARQAEALLQEGVTEPVLAKRVQGLLGELAEEEADKLLVQRLEEIRLLQAEVNVKENRFALEKALPEYRQAFLSYGLQAQTMAPQEAAALLRRRPPAVRSTLVAALDHWLVLARDQKAPEVDWLEQVLSAAVADPWRQRLRAARARGDRQALEKLARELDVTTQPAEVLFLLDRGLHAQGATEGAVALLRRAQEAFPGDFWINHNLGIALVDCRPPQYDEAIRFLTAAVALRPNSPGVSFNLGLVFWKKGRLDEALAAFRRAVTLKPDYAEAHGSLGVVLWKKGRLDEALASLRQAIVLKPDSSDAHFNLGNALIEKGQLDEGLAALRRAVDLNPNNAEDCCHLGVILAGKGRLDEAAAAFKEAIRLKPEYAEAHYNLANVLKTKGRLDEAVAAYRQAIASKSDCAEAHCNLANTLVKLGRFDDALAAYRRAIVLKPNLVEAHFNLGLAFTRMGRLDEAIAEFRQSIALKPDWAMAHYDLGNALWKRGRLDEATAAYRQAIQLKPDYAEAYCNLGNLLRQQGHFVQALAALKQGHELSSRHPDWIYPSALWVKQCQRLVELDGRQQAVVRGELQPGSATERSEFAQLCFCKKYYAAAARLWAEAFLANPKLATDLNAGHRYGAAGAAALAAAGQGAEAARLSDQERAHWRKQALQWLRADLTANGKLLGTSTPQDRQLAQLRLRQWPCDPNLASVRDPAALAQLPANEQAMCEQLWADVETLLAKAATANQE
jgi:tetratricopeptide (TPR) repeat protein